MKYLFNSYVLKGKHYAMPVSTILSNNILSFFLPSLPRFQRVGPNKKPNSCWTKVGVCYTLPYSNSLFQIQLHIFKVNVFCIYIY